MHACVRACVRACVCACMRVCVYVCVQECVCACMRVHCWHIVEFASLYTPHPPPPHPIIIMKHILNHKHKLWLLFRYPFHPCVAAVACKRPRSFCLKCRWQVTAKHACGFAWIDMVHGCMVYTERAEMAAVSCVTSHASDVSTPLRWIFKKHAIKKEKLFTHVESHASTEILLESGEWRYIKAINNNKRAKIVQ